MQKLEILIEENAFGAVRPVEVVADAPVAALIPALVAELKLPRTDLFGKKLVYMLRQSGDEHIIPENATLITAGVHSGARLTLDSYVLDTPVVSSRQQMQPQPSYTHSPAVQLPQLPLADPALHSSVTIADGSSFAPPGHSPQQEAFPPPGANRQYNGFARSADYPQQVLSPQSAPYYNEFAQNPYSQPLREHTSGLHLPVDTSRSGGRWSRRAFIAAVGTVLGVGGAGLGYAAYHKFMNQPGATPGVGTQPNRQTAPLQNPVQTTQAQPKPTQPSAMNAFPTKATAQFTFMQHQQTVRTVAWSPMGLLASGADDMHVFVWGVNGVVQRDFAHPASVRALAWSPDGQRLVTGANNQVTFFNVQSGAMLARSTHRHSQMVTSLAWTPQSGMQVVSGGMDKLAIVWDTGNYHSQTIYRTHTQPIAAVSWANDGQSVASSSQGGAIRVWNAANGQDLHGYYQDGPMPMRATAFAPNDTRLAVGGDDGIVRIWNGLTCGNAGNRCNDVPQRIQASQKAIRTLAWSPAGRVLAVGGEDNMFSLWTPGQNQGALLKMQQNALIHSIAWSPDGKALATASGNTVTIWTLS